jgi:preprotein translocase subunit SecB
MDIKFIESKLLSLSFLTEQDGLEDNFNLKYTSAFSADESKKFIVKFDVNLTSDNGVSISLEYMGLFETEVEITEEFQQGKFVTINAPAIIFPYLRSFVTTFTVNAGLNPVILPTINFQALADAAAKEA